MDDMQSWLKQYAADHPHDVVHITEEVPRDHVVTATALAAERLAEPPAFVFERLEGSDYPVVTNLFASRARIARATGTTAAELHSHWASISKALISPVAVESGVCQEVCYYGEDVDLNQLPLMIHFEQDAGRYLTAGVIVARDPDHGWGNLSFARMQLSGARSLGVSLHSRGHLWDYQQRSEARGHDLEVAVVVGMHPAFVIGAASRVSIEIDEYDIVGALLGHPLRVVPCKTVGLNVPADAEIILEGVVRAGERAPEGPFGEYTGYSTGRSTNNVMEIRAITRRSSPYFLDVCPGASRDHLLLGRVQKEAEVLRKLREVLPNVKGIHYPTSGTHYHCYVSIQKQRPGDGRHAALLVLGLDAYVKLVVVVDDDVDISNEADVMWAIATRMQPREDAFIIDEMTCNVLDPSSHGGVSSKLGIDATRPEGWDAQRTTLPREATERAAQLLRAYLG
jgi:4-hydroxy-3-polyprenylbenzoate decarboxylase